MQFVLDVLIAIFGAVSVIMGVVGIGQMGSLWRLLHVVAGLVMLLGTIPMIISRDRH